MIQTLHHSQLLHNKSSRVSLSDLPQFWVLELASLHELSEFFTPKMYEAVLTVHRGSSSDIDTRWTKAVRFELASEQGHDMQPEICVPYHIANVAKRTLSNDDRRNFYGEFLFNACIDNIRHKQHRTSWFTVDMTYGEGEPRKIHVMLEFEQGRRLLEKVYPPPNSSTMKQKLPTLPHNDGVGNTE
ncbi:10453a69-0bf6-4e10-84fc-c2cb7d64b028 [Sclerotinia trifoliorum]|uniref:10453a69-0bf6-4e10-84fc-c2cb7d64b028 n=1 Tax=Sclerotinia trifoliorum TaxID=28548 RepID=A0A8H2ZKG9_9HELO|nr:10453a69-0bf6-4e10-84fc-c2cb7d64b028 [Sclerotinia trifoliorum]